VRNTARVSSLAPVDGLEQIATRYGTDKADPYRDLIAVYETLLEPRRAESLRLLEVGVLDGASLRTWEDYLPNATIYAVDIRPTAVEHASDRTAVLIGDASDETVLAQLRSLGPFDIIIDDGSHFQHHQRATLLGLWAAVTAGGAYIVEDAHTSYLPKWGGGYRKPETLVELAKEIVDDVNAWWHEQPVILEGVGSVQIHPEMCVFTKRADLFRRGVVPDPQKRAALEVPDPGSVPPQKRQVP
jgi:methyltransferase family protein